jgi:hypothetical protein
MYFAKDVEEVTTEFKTLIAQESTTKDNVLHKIAHLASEGNKYRASLVFKELKAIQDCSDTGI